MACIGNTDATRNGDGTSIFDTTTDITTMPAAEMATMKLGARAVSPQNGAAYVLTETGGVRSWLQTTP